MTTAIQIDQNDGFAQQVATNGQTIFDYDFPIYEGTYIEVLRRRDGVLTTIDPADYTVQDVEVEAGGTITLDTGAEAGDIITMRLNVPEARTTDFQVAGDFFANTLNRELDLQTQMIQQLRRDLSRAARLADDSALDAVVLPTPVDGRALIWDGTDGQLKNSETDLTLLDANAAALNAINSEIVIVAANVADIQTVADNIADIQNAEENADLAAAYARLTPEDVTGTTYTLDINDENKMLRTTNGSAVAVTVPPNSDVAFPVGSRVFFTQSGAGQITFGPGSGVTIESIYSFLKSEAQYSVMCLYKRATNVWMLFGELAP